MSQPNLADSTEPWRYIIVLSKFMFLFIDGGIAKSFGLLIPETIVRFDSDYKTIGFISGLSTFMYATAPIANLLSKVIKPRTLGIGGGMLTGMALVCVPLTDSVYLLGMMSVLAGFGNTLVFLPMFASVNNFFPRSFIFVDTLTQFGSACGAFIVPVIIERSREAYGYEGAFLILGGIAFNGAVCAACIRSPMDLQNDSVEPEANSAEVDRQLSLMSPNERLSFTEQLGHTSTADYAINTSLDSEQGSNASSKPKQTLVLSSSGQTKLEESRGALLEMDSDTTRTQRLVRCCTFFCSWLRSLTVISEPLFTLVIPAIFFEGYFMHVWMLFLVPHAECIGIEKSQAVFTSSIAGFSGIIGKILFVVLIHFRVNSTLIFTFTSLIGATSFFIDAISTEFVFLAIMASVQGFCMFLLHCFPVAVVKLSVRDEENMESALSSFLFVQAIGSLTGDTASGHVFDVASSCSTIFVMLGVILVAVSGNLLTFYFVDRHYARTFNSN